MRESIGGTWTMQIVIVFILFFVAFITLTINYTRAFKVKNEVINIIEREEGLTMDATSNTDIAGDTAGARTLISYYLRQNGYNTMGRCPVGWSGVSSLNPDDTRNDTYFTEVTNSNKNNKYYYCVQKVLVPPRGKAASLDVNYKKRSYYKVKLFFKFSLPVVGDITTFGVEGETIDIYFNPSEKNVNRLDPENPILNQG